MKNNKTTRNLKKLRRAAKARLNRKLTADQVQRLYHAALDADAPVMAEKILNMRGGITVAEAKALVRLVNVEADVNHSVTRVILRVRGEKDDVM